MTNGARALTVNEDLSRYGILDDETLALHPFDVDVKVTVGRSTHQFATRDNVERKGLQLV